MDRLTKAKIDVVKCELSNLLDSAKEIQNKLLLDVIAKQEKTQKLKEMLPVYESAAVIDEVINLLEASLNKFE